LRLTRPANLFQPYGETLPDRYPELFGFTRLEIGDSPAVRLLSFGCARGDEIVSLRHYFPLATIRGVDISRGNIKECRRRRDLAKDPGIEFARAGGAQGEPPSHYDAIFCMAVFRHGDLTGQRRQSCADFIKFDAFERTVAGLSKCLKPGALLVIEHCNFRFEDTATSQAFECIRRRARADWEAERTPLFGSDNLALPPPEEIGTVFRKRAT
jgi:SAM-dependent methyltransferase